MIQLFDIKEAAEKSGVSVRTIRRLVTSKKAAAVKVGASLYFPEKEVAKIAKHKDK